MYLRSVLEWSATIYVELEDIPHMYLIWVIAKVKVLQNVACPNGHKVPVALQVVIPKLSEKDLFFRSKYTDLLTSLAVVFNNVYTSLASTIRLAWVTQYRGPLPSFETPRLSQWIPPSPLCLLCRSWLPLWLWQFLVMSINQLWPPQLNSGAIVGYMWK